MSTNDDEARLLRSVALQNASSILIARLRAEQRQEAYLAEAQRLSHTGSFGWRVATGEIVWSEETYRIFQYDRTTTPTVESVLQRVHGIGHLSVDHRGAWRPVVGRAKPGARGHILVQPACRD